MTKAEVSNDIYISLRDRSTVWNNLPVLPAIFLVGLIVMAVKKIKATMNTRVKGSRLRLAAKKVFEDMGFLVDIVEKTHRFAPIRDCFGVADLIAIKKNSVVLIQVTANRPHTHGQFEEFSREYCGSNVGMQQWVWIDNKGWRVFAYEDGKKIRVPK